MALAVHNHPDTTVPSTRFKAAYTDVDRKNGLCTVIPHPDDSIDFLRTTLAQNLNHLRWAADPELTSWLSDSRLDVFSGPLPDGNPLDPARQDAERVFAESLAPAIEKLRRLLDESGTPGQASTAGS